MATEINTTTEIDLTDDLFGFIKHYPDDIKFECERVPQPTFKVGRYGYCVKTEKLKIYWTHLVGQQNHINHLVFIDVLIELNKKYEQSFSTEYDIQKFYIYKLYPGPTVFDSNTFDPKQPLLIRYFAAHW